MNKVDIRTTLKDFARDWESGKFILSFELNEGSIEDISNFKGMDLMLTIKKFSRHRSNDANKMLWGIISQISEASGEDKWQVYIDLIRRQNKYTYMAVKPEAVDDLKKVWREIEITGPIDVNGQNMVGVLCHYGSSTYNVYEFSSLLADAVSDLKDLGIAPPPSQEMKRTLEQWQKEHP